VKEGMVKERTAKAVAAKRGRFASGGMAADNKGKALMESR